MEKAKEDFLFYIKAVKLNVVYRTFELGVNALLSTAFFNKAYVKSEIRLCSYAS